MAVSSQGPAAMLHDRARLWEGHPSSRDRREGCRGVSSGGSRFLGRIKMREAVIVSTARTPIGRAYRGAFNDTQAQALAGHVVAEAVRRAGMEPAEVEDVVLGAAL